MNDQHIPVFRAKDPEDEAALATARQLQHLFTPLKAHPHADDLLRILGSHLLTVTRALIRLEEAYKAGVSAEIEEQENKFRRLLSRRAPFTALSRSLVPPRYQSLFDSPQDHAP